MAGPSCRVGGRFLTQSSHWHICKNKKRYYSISIANGAKRDPREIEKLDIFISGQPRSPIILVLFILDTLGVVRKTFFSTGR
jgi:hypothetical protein